MIEILNLNGVEINKQTIERIRKDIFSKVENGEIDPIKINAFIKFYEKVFTGDDKKNNGLSHLIRPYVVDELEKDKTRSDYYGFKVEIKEAGVRYDFSNCGHPELEELYEKQKQLKSEIDEIEKLLKSIPAGKRIPIIVHGEAIEVHAPARFSTTSPTFRI